MKQNIELTQVSEPYCNTLIELEKIKERSQVILKLRQEYQAEMSSRTLSTILQCDGIFGAQIVSSFILFGSKRCVSSKNSLYTPTASFELFNTHPEY